MPFSTFAWKRVKGTNKGSQPMDRGTTGWRRAPFTRGAMAVPAHAGCRGRARWARDVTFAGGMGLDAGAAGRTAHQVGLLPRALGRFPCGAVSIGTRHARRRHVHPAGRLSRPWQSVHRLQQRDDALREHPHVRHSTPRRDRGGMRRSRRMDSSAPDRRMRCARRPDRSRNAIRDHHLARLCARTHLPSGGPPRRHAKRRPAARPA